MTEAQWAELLLTDAGDPTTTNNVDNVMKWMTREEPTTDWADRDNPLNASLDTTSADGLGTYPSLQVGAQETADMIEQSNMSGIQAALQANAPVDTFSAAVVASPWASSHYGGNPDAIAKVGTPSGTTLASGVPGAAAGSGQTGGAAPGGSWELQLQNVLNPSGGVSITNLTGGLEMIGARLGLTVIGLLMILAGLGIIGVEAFKSAPAPVKAVMATAAKAGAALA
ncbi:MAG: hypothetical protein WA634_02475 [Silvibacterium sp.]